MSYVGFTSPAAKRIRSTPSKILKSPLGSSRMRDHKFTDVMSNGNTWSTPTATPLSDMAEKDNQVSARTHNNAILTRRFLEEDDTCMTSTYIYPLLQSVWKFGALHRVPPPQALEIDAGQRYFLQDGTLAEEWVRFFQVAPDRFLEASPQEVRESFQKQVRPLTLVGQSFEAIMQSELQHETDLYKIKQLRRLLVLPVEFRDPALDEAEFGRIPSSTIGSQNDSSIFITPPPLVTSSNLPTKRKLSDLDQDNSRLFEADTTPSRQVSSKRSPYDSEAVDSSQARWNLSESNSSGSVLGQHITPRSGSSTMTSLSGPTGGQQQLLSGHASAITPVSSRQAIPVQQAQPVPSVQPIQVMQPSPVAWSAFALQSVPTATHAFVQNPAGPPILAQLLHSRGITTLPGSLIPPDRGNYNKAWHAERIRAFVQIQGKSLSELPDAAFAEYGDEMSNLRTPASVDSRCCPFDISVYEMLTYFSEACTLNRDMCHRITQNWGGADITRYVNYVHDLQDPKSFSRSKIGYRKLEADKMFRDARSGYVHNASLRNIHMDSGLKGEDSVVHDYPIYHLGDGVVRPPTGRQAQMLTRVIHHVRNVTRDRNVTLSHAATYAQRHGITVPTYERMGTNLDVEDALSDALRRTIKADYKRKYGKDP